MSSMRVWQMEAIAAWEANAGRGIVAAATGTGKTRLALEVLARAVERSARSMVVVPTRVLQEQWLRELKSARIVASSRLGTIGGPSPAPSPDHLIIVAVIDSARTGARNLIHHWNSMGVPTLLIVDECHWAGSAHNRGVFVGDATWRLGLSATPERGDDGFDDILVPELGGTIYAYPLKKAMDDGVLAELQLVNLIIDLSRAEVTEYKAIETRLLALQADLESKRPDLFLHQDWTAAVGMAANDEPLARRLHVLVGERRRLLARSSGRLVVLRNLMSDGLLDGRRTIIFNETIDQAQRVADMASERGASVAIDHSRMSTRDRMSNQAQFRHGNAQCLVVVRTADEGVDVPSADQAVIVSGSMNPRQRIQRLGRVVRQGGLPPRALSLLARGTPEESVVGGRDLELLGATRVRTVSAGNTSGAALWL